MSFKSGFERREREPQFNTAGGSEFQVRGVAVLKDRLVNDVRRNGTHSSGTDDHRVLRALVRSEMCWLVYRHFRPKTLRTQDISALCVWCQSVSDFCVGAEVSNGHTSAPVPKCLGQFGTKVYETLRSSDPELKYALSVAIVLRNVDPLYILYPNGMKVLGRQGFTW